MARVYISVVIDSPIDKVWRRIRDFNALPSWHPLIRASRIEGDLASVAVGCVRNFQLRETGVTIREQLLALSDAERYCTYSILESPLAIEGYLARLQLIEITEGDKTLGQWQAEFHTPDELEAETVGQVATIFRQGLLNLRDMRFS